MSSPSCWRVCWAAPRAGGVGRSAAQDARHVGHRDPEGVAQGYGKRRAEQDDGDGWRDEAQPVGPHRAEETRSDLQSEGIDEDDQSEILGVDQHRGVERQPEVSGEDAHEEDEGRAERDAEEADLAQTDADRRDERDHHDGLQGRMFDQERFKPFHPMRTVNRCKSRSNFPDCRLSAPKSALSVFEPGKTERRPRPAALHRGLRSGDGTVVRAGAVRRGRSRGSSNGRRIRIWPARLRPQPSPCGSWRR